MQHDLTLMPFTELCFIHMVLKGIMAIIIIIIINN